MEFTGGAVRYRREPHRHVHREARLDLPRLHQERDDEVHRVRHGVEPHRPVHDLPHRRLGGWGSYREGPALVQLDNGGWRLFFDGYGDGTYYYSDSYDTFATWSAPAALPAVSGTARHFTVIKETVSGGPALAKNVTRSFQSANYTTRYWQAQSSLLNIPVVSGSSTAAEKQSSTFTVVPGLADANGYSFRDSSGKYLRHWDFRARFDTNDGTSTFARDATFVARTGTSSGSLRFESYNYPGYYLRHYSYQLRVERADGTELFRQDSSFVPVTAWV